MWRRYRNFVKVTSLTLSASLLLSFSCLAAGVSIPPTEQSTNIVMSMTQYNRLKQIISRQDSRLTQLQEKLNLLKSNSAEASNELEKSQTELTTLRNELTETQQSLESAKLSLRQAEEILKKQEASLKQLTKEIKQMEHKQTVMRRQRDVYALLSCVLLGYSLSK